MTHEHLDKLELIAHYLNERQRGFLLGKSAFSTSTARKAYALGISDMTREILAAFELRLRQETPPEPLTFAPAAVAPPAPQTAEVTLPTGGHNVTE